MKEIEPQKAFFIKLGRNGEWEPTCIEEDHTIRLGFKETDHDACIAGEWDKIRKDELRNGRAKGKATEITNEIRRFYEEGEDTLWITFYANRMWWCFARHGVRRLDDGSKVRKVIGQWYDTDIHGQPLSLETISGKLLQVRGFRGTNCCVDLSYVTNKINGVTSPAVKYSIGCLETLRSSLIPLIQNLTWQDFELLVDLVFSNAGWQRVGVLGKTEKSIDLDLRSPVTGERVMVQIKASSDKDEFASYCNKFSHMKDFAAFFYVVHTPKKSLINAKAPTPIQMVFGDQLANLVVNAGLVKWLIEKNK